MTRSRRRLVAVLVLSAAVAAVGWWLLRSSDLARVRAELDAADPGWRFADIRAARLADQPHPDDNPALVALAAVRLAPAAYDDWLKAGGFDPEPGGRPMNRRPDEPGWEAMWRATAPAAAAARRVKDLRRGFDPVTVAADPFMTLLPNVQDTRRASRLLNTDAVFATAHGDAGGAADSVRAVLQLGRAVGREPFVICYLVQQAHRLQAADAVARSLAVGTWPDAELATVQADLATAADPAGWATGLRDFRAEIDLEMSAVAAGDADLGAAVGIVASRGGATPPNLVERFRYRLDSAADHARSLVRFTELVAIAGRPAHEWVEAEAALPLPPDDGRHLLSRPNAEVGRKLMAGAVRHLAVLRTAALAVGCERFRLRHGRWPDSVAELPADLTPGDTTDPFTGGRLVVRRLPDGLAVYSLGPDKADDGGTFGPAPAQPPRQDVGWQLWDVAARGRPPAQP